MTMLSCASSPMIQPQINSLVVAERFDSALRILKEHRHSYGEHNDLLYFMDYGLVLHLAGNFRESIGVFKRAKGKYDQLYTISLTKKAATWIVNDNLEEYRGENFERVMINIFQALNFAQLGEIDKALVEARDVDSVLNIINRQYSSDQSNVYSKDAFARLLMGVFYSAAGGRQNINDAYISYVKAYEAYQKLYTQYYGVSTPHILQEDLLATAHYLNFSEFNTWKEDFGDVSYIPFKKRTQLAQIIFVHYRGLSPIKHQVDLLLPLPDGYISRIAFPKYIRRQNVDKVFTVHLKQDGAIIQSQTIEIVEDITEIAIRNLQEKQLRVMAKAVLRTSGKQMVLLTAENNIRRNAGNVAGNIVKYAGTAYNIFSEQADLRSWQTLPAEIGLARVFISPGDYDVLLNESSIVSNHFSAGQTYFIIHRTSQ